MDEDWKRNISDGSKWWGKSERDSKIDSLMYDLRDSLINMGGEVACMPQIDGDIDKIMSRGQLWTGETLKMDEGESSQCHYNSCVLWDNNEEDNLFIATGYALSEDGGMWRQHSWCVQKNSNGVQIIETTEPRVLYFGFVLNLAETKEFVLNNADLVVNLSKETLARYNELEIPTLYGPKY